MASGARAGARPFVTSRVFSALALGALLSTTAIVGPAAAQTGPAKRGAGAPVSEPVAPNQGAALRKAETSGERVEVLAERTEFSQLFAEPTGELTFESTVLPERVRQDDGSWKDVDLSLVSTGSGPIRPRASVADVRFSPGGTEPLVTMVNDDATFTLGWSGGALPKPVTSGDSATYAEVLPGVDLVVRATPQGFSHVLTVKSATAAANPALREIRFDLGGDAEVLRAPDGSLRAVAGDTLVASAAAPAMWDSRAAAAAGTPFMSGAAKVSAGTSAADTRSNLPSTPIGPGDTARVVGVATGLTKGGDLLLRPDASLLSASAVYPVFIDPEWSKGKSRWAYATNNNSNNSDTSVARVGKDPDSGKLYRSFFEFPTTTLKLKHIESAYVQMKLDHSWSCTDTPTHMYHSGALSATPRTAWSTKLISRISGADSHANEGSGCSDSPQPDMTVNFTGSQVTSLIQSIANNSTSAITIGFSAGNAAGEYETATDRWKKFFPGNAKLIANIDAKPGKPYSLQVNGVACTTSTDVRIGLTNPYFSAIFPDGDTSQDIKGTWEWYEVPASGSWVAKSAPGQTTADANARGTTARVSGATSGKRFVVRAKGTDPAPYSITSGWSDWCYFVVDTTVPNVSATAVEVPSGPGKSGRFKITSTSTDVATFRYGWSDTVPFTATPLTEAGVTGRYASLTVTAPKYGINTLFLRAIDTTNNAGYGSVEFGVDRPAPAVARWGLETYPGTDTATALEDQQKATAGDTPLTGTGVTWTDQGRLIDTQNATFTGASALTTEAGLVDTTRSFAVAAWAQLDTATGYQNLVSQDGDHSANFQLQYRPDDVTGDGIADRSWCFTLRVSDTDKAGLTMACAANTATVGRWTHVAGGYDAAEKKLRIFVDGVQKAEVAAPAVWASTGPLRVGNRKYTSTQWLDDLHGSVADVQVFDRMLVPQDFTGQLASDENSGGVDEPGILRPIEVGRWDFETAVPCYDPALAGTCEAPDGAAWGRRLRLTQGANIGSGNQGSGVQFSDTHFVEDPTDPNYRRIGQQYAASQRSTVPAGQPAQWKDAPVLRTDESFAVTAWVQVNKLGVSMNAVSQQGAAHSAFYLGTRVSTVGGVTGTRFQVMTSSVDHFTGETWTNTTAKDVLTDDSTGDWSQLALVYDSAAKRLSLYVNGTFQGDSSFTAWQANGPLLVGSSWFTSNEGVGSYTDQWHGAIDDVRAYQGALTAAQVRLQYDEQAVPEAS